MQGRSQQAGALNATHFNPAVEFGGLTQYRFKGGALVLCSVQAAEDLGFQDQKGKAAERGGGITSPQDPAAGGSSSLQPPCS